MNKWIKLNDLPEDFWGDCFCSWYAGEGDYAMDVSAIKVINSTAYWYCTYEQDWVTFRADVEYRVLPIVYPTITEEDFK